LLVDKDLYFLTLINNNGELYFNDQPWSPITIFPSFQTDTLLYLSLMGGLNISAFYNRENEIISFRSALEQTLNSLDLKRQIFCFDNAVQATSDGMLYEALLCGAIVVASHCGGLCGTTLNNFLLQLFFHCFNIKIEEINFPNEIEVFRKKKIPFMSPPNTLFPNFFNQEIDRDLFIGNLSRTVNNAQIDLLCVSLTGEIILTAESKDYANSIDSETMQNIIKKIPKESKLHIVFTNVLQQSYFQKGSYDIFADNHLKGRNIIYGHFLFEETQGHKTSVKIAKIVGLPESSMEKVHCLVIFIASSINQFAIKDNHQQKKRKASDEI